MAFADDECVMMANGEWRMTDNGLLIWPSARLSLLLFYSICYLSVHFLSLSHSLKNNSLEIKTQEKVNKKRLLGLLIEYRYTSIENHSQMQWNRWDKQRCVSNWSIDRSLDRSIDLSFHVLTDASEKIREKWTMVLELIMIQEDNRWRKLLCWWVGVVNTFQVIGLLQYSKH